MISNHLLTFQTDNQVYGLPLNVVKEVLHSAQLISPHTRPHFLCGFLDLGDHIVTVINLRSLWNLPECSVSLYTPLIVLNNKIALQVDKIKEVFAVPQGTIQPVLENHTLNNCIDATCIVSSQTIHRINIDQLLLFEEHTRLTDLKQQTEFRLSQLRNLT